MQTDNKDTLFQHLTVLYAMHDTGGEELRRQGIDLAPDYYHANLKRIFAVKDQLSDIDQNWKVAYADWLASASV